MRERYQAVYDESKREFYVAYIVEDGPYYLDQWDCEVVFRASLVELQYDPHAVADRIRKAGLPWSVVTELGDIRARAADAARSRQKKQEALRLYNLPRARIARELPGITQAELDALLDEVPNEGQIQMADELEQIGLPNLEDEDPIGSPPMA